MWCITLTHSAVVDLIWYREFNLAVLPLPGEPNHLGHFFMQPYIIEKNIFVQTGNYIYVSIVESLWVCAQPFPCHHLLKLRCPFKSLEITQWKSVHFFFKCCPEIWIHAVYKDNQEVSTHEATCVTSGIQAVIWSKHIHCGNTTYVLDYP